MWYVGEVNGFWNLLVGSVVNSPIILECLFASVPAFGVIAPLLSKVAVKSTLKQFAKNRKQLIESANRLEEFWNKLEGKAGVSLKEFKNKNASSKERARVSFVKVDYYGEYQSPSKDVNDDLTGTKVADKTTNTGVYSVAIEGKSDKLWFVAASIVVVNSLNRTTGTNEMVLPEVHVLNEENLDEGLIAWVEEQEPSTFYLPRTADGFENVLDHYEKNPPKRKVKKR